MGKAQIIKRIHRAAKKYNSYFIGNTYMFVYENQYIEVMFKKSSFLHLTGVDTNLSAENFYEHALIRNGLRPQEISFNINKPYDLADKKTSYLEDLYKITVTDVLIATNITTMTFKYSIGISNLEFTICLGDDVNSTGHLASKNKIPYSFRVEELSTSNIGDLYAVTHVFKKKTGTKTYSELTFGSKDTIETLPKEIQSKIALS